MSSISINLSIHHNAPQSLPEGHYGVSTSVSVIVRVFSNVLVNPFISLAILQGQRQHSAPMPILGSPMVSGSVFALIVSIAVQVRSLFNVSQVISSSFRQLLRSLLVSLPDQDFGPLYGSSLWSSMGFLFWFFLWIQRGFLSAVLPELLASVWSKVLNEVSSLVVCKVAGQVLGQG